MSRLTRFLPAVCCLTLLPFAAEAKKGRKPQARVWIAADRWLDYSIEMTNYGACVLYFRNKGNRTAQYVGWKTEYIDRYSGKWAYEKHSETIAPEQQPHPPYRWTVGTKQCELGKVKVTIEGIRY